MDTATNIINSDNLSKNDKNKNKLVRFRETIELKQLDVFYSKKVADFHNIVLQCKELNIKLVQLYKNVTLESLKHIPQKHIIEGKHSITVLHSDMGVADKQNVPIDQNNEL